MSQNNFCCKAFFKYAIRGLVVVFTILLLAAQVSAIPIGPIFDETAPPTNASLSSATSNNGSFSITWDHAFDAGNGSTYIISEFTNAIGSVSYPTKQFNITGKGDGTYTYFVRHSNNFGPSTAASAGSITVRNKPSTPSAPSNINTTSTSYTVTWSKPAGSVTYYDVQERVAGGSWSTIVTGTTALSRSISGKANNTNYEYRVRACNGYSWSCSVYGAVNSVKVRTKPSAPSAPGNINSTSTGFTVSWNKPAGTISYYNLQERIVGGSWITIATAATSTSKIVSGKVDGSNYEYRVLACNSYSWACSAYSGINSVKVRVKPSTPAAPSRPSTSTGSAPISWVKPSGNVTYYDLNKRLNNSGSWLTGTSGLTVTSKTLSGLTDGLWDFRLRACNQYSWACSAYSGASADTTVRVKPGVPTAPTLPSTNNDSVTVSWAKPSGAVTYYDLQKRLNNTVNWQSAGSGLTGTSQSVSGLNDGVWDFRVRACNQYSWSCSAYGSISDDTTTRSKPSTPSAPSNINTTSTSYSVNWSKPAGSINYYDLQERVAGGSWSTIVSGTAALSRAISGKANNTNYEYRVRACNSYSWACSSYSAANSVKIRNTPAVPVAPTNINSTSTSYIVNWNKPAGSVSYYDLQERIVGGSWATVASATTSTNKALTGRVNGNDYQYQVRACNSYNWACSSYSSANSVKVRLKPNVPGVPTTSSTDTDGSFGVNWTAPSGSFSYFVIQNQKDGEGWTTWISNTSGFSRTTSALADGNWQFRIKACNEYSWACSGYSVASTVTEVRRIPSAVAVNLPPVSKAHQAFLVTASANGTVTGYTLSERKQGTTTWSMVALNSSNTAAITKSVIGEKWEYKARACNKSFACAESTPRTIDITSPELSDITDATFVTAATPTHDATIGQINPKISVNGGAVGASIPIVIPPGRAGMQPNISINYSSDSGNGLIGRGWTLSAGSTIRRCADTYDIDGTARNTMDDNKDKLCLDGGRLMVEILSNYGVSGAIYHPENNPQISVVQTGSLYSNTGISFIVGYPNGNQSSYGSNAQSKVLREGTGVEIAWKIAKKSDRLDNNNITYQYQSFDGYSLIEQILYTGSSSQQGTRTIHFVYQDRGDQRVAYRNGGKRWFAHRLESIETQVNNVSIRKYNFAYEGQNDDSVEIHPSSTTCTTGIVLCGVTNPIADRISILSSIEMCAGTTCFPKTSLNYYPLLSGFDDKVFAFVDNARSSDIQSKGDFNGDSVNDLVVKNKVYMSDRSTGISNTVVVDGYLPEGPEYNQRVYGNVMDFNLDGRADLVGMGPLSSEGALSFFSMSENSSVFIRQDDLSLHNRCSAYPGLLINPNGNPDAEGRFFDCSTYIADVNGDGKQDIITSYQVDISTYNRPEVVLKVYLNTYDPVLLDDGKPSFTLAWTSSQTIKSYDAALVTDVNGDGYADLVYDRLDEAWLSIVDGNGQFTGFDKQANYFGLGILIDVNNDGLLDNLAKDGYYPNNGKGMESQLISFDTLPDIPAYNSNYETRDDVFRRIDFNNDGLPDLLVRGDLYIASRCLAGNCDPAVNTSLKKYDLYHWHFKQAYLKSDGSIGYQDDPTGTLIASGSFMSFVDFDNDGYLDLLVGRGMSSNTVEMADNMREGYYVYYSRAFSTDRLKEVSTGFGVKHQFDYKTLANDDQFYRVANTVQEFPSQGMQSNREAVQAYRTSNGFGGLSQTKFEYSQGVYHKQGRGFQGFGEIVEQKFESDSDTQAFAQVTTDYLQTYPFSGMLSRSLSEVWDAAINDWRTISETNNRNPTRIAGAYAGTFVDFQADSSSISYELDGSIISQQSSSTGLNSFGQMTSKTTTAFDGNSQAGANVMKSTTQTATYASTETTGEWYKLMSKTNQSTVVYGGAVTLGMPAGALSSVTVYQDFDYTGSDRRPTSVVTRTRDEPYRLTVATDYKGVFGQVSQITTTSNGLGTHQVEGSRWKQLSYSTNGYFVEKTYNSEWGSSVAEVQNFYDAATGQITSSTDANGIVITNDYDAFGRLLSATSGGLPPAMSGWQSCPAQCSTAANGRQAVYKITTAQAGKPDARSYFDKLGREVYKEVDSVNSKVIVAWKDYDVRGRVAAAVEPHFEAETSGYGVVNYTSFDLLNRVLTKEVHRDPIDYNVTYGFSGLRQTVNVTPTTAGYAIHMETQNSVLGQPLWHQDADGKQTKFLYDALGNPVVVQDVAGQSITAIYNGFGHKTQLTDPNMGRWTFSYNALGELRQQTDANLQVTDLNYDALGRIITRAPVGDTASHFVFDQSDGNGKHYGQLNQEYKGGDFDRTVDLDWLQRPTSVTTTIDGNRSFVQQMSYDGNYGRLKGEQYPSGVVIEHQYNELGMALETRDFVADKSLRVVSDFDAQGRIIEQQFGEFISEFNDYTVAGLLKERCANLTGVQCITGSKNGNDLQHLYYQSYDGYGNLTYLENLVIGQQEGFTYDNLHRLTQSNRTWTDNTYSTQYATVNYTYDAVGNLTSKSDFSQGAGAYVYGDALKANTNNAGSNAVKRVTLVDGSTQSYNYDNNGNLTSDGIRTISYGANNKPVTINANSTGSEVNFSYGSDGQRYKQVKTVSSNTTTTYYAGAYELEETLSSSKSRTSIGGFALYTIENNVGKWHYTLTDHLGSMDTILDENGVVEQRRNYDPFGKARDDRSDDTKHGPLYTAPSELFGGQLASDITPRGFTNHEHLDEVELIHMNGRVYDYNLGRFLSVDPFISMPGNSQAYNPYSYVMNNPLSYTDPTGYITESNYKTGLAAQNDDEAPLDVKSRREKKDFERCARDPNCAVLKSAFSWLNGGNGSDSASGDSTNLTNKVDGTYIFGGAGMDGDYIGDMVNKFEEAGISDVHAVNSEEWSGGTLPDALVGVLALNEEVDTSDKIVNMREKFENKGDGKGQLNLVGYSYGSLVAAQVAMTRVQKGGTVDNLVLIGSPISKEFLNTLRNTEGIRNVIVKNLTQYGDPIFAGMSGAQVAKSSFTLAGQMLSGTGHFYYAPNNVTGRVRRRVLAWELYNDGLR